MSIIFNRYVNDPSTDEQDLHARSGQVVTLIGEPFDAEPSFPAEHIIMQKIKFEDGFEAEAFIDELTEA